MEVGGGSREIKVVARYGAPQYRQSLEKENITYPPTAWSCDESEAPGFEEVSSLFGAL